MEGNKLKALLKKKTTDLLCPRKGILAAEGV